MNHYVLYNAGTGQIHQNFSAQDDEEAQIVATAMASSFKQVEAAVDNSLLYVVGNGFRAIPSQPHPSCVWSWTEHKWVDPRSLDEARAAARARVNTARDAAQTAGFEVAGRRYDADPESVVNLIGVALAAFMSVSAGQPFNQTWTLFDNSNVELDGFELIDAAMGLMGFRSGIYAKGRNLKDAIAAATDLETIDNIKW